VKKGQVLIELNQIREALTTYEYVLSFDPENMDAYRGKGDSLFYLRLYDEAMAIYEYILSLHPDDMDAYERKGNILYSLQRYDEAIDIYRNKGNILYRLRYYNEALAAYDQVIHLRPLDAVAHNGRGDALKRLGRFREAELAYKYAHELGYDRSQTQDDI
jgi:tetratricopeptide (TPR) repeat protein